MHYKTITLELLSQNPKLHDLLRTEKTLLSMTEACALTLRKRHQTFKEQLTATNPQLNPSQISSMAMELATRELELRLQAAFPQDDGETYSPESAMVFLRNLTSQS